MPRGMAEIFAKNRKNVDFIVKKPLTMWLFGTIIGLYLVERQRANKSPWYRDKQQTRRRNRSDHHVNTGNDSGS